LPIFGVILQVKRTSLWNKACEELRRHQDLLSKFKDDKAFQGEPYGNPFADSAEMRAALSGGVGSGAESAQVGLGLQKRNPWFELIKIIPWFGLL